MLSGELATESYLESDVAAEPDVAGDSQVVELDEVGNASEALQEAVYLIE